MQTTRWMFSVLGTALGLVGLTEPSVAQQCAWSALGSGMRGSILPKVNALTVFDDGTGPALYAGGLFTTAGGVPANHIAKWDGKEWSALGSGTGGNTFFTPGECVDGLR